MISAVGKSWYWLAQNCRRYIPVAHYMAVAQAKNEFAGTFGGILWWIGEPILYTFIYYFIFAVVFEAKSDNLILFLLLGLVAWRWFARTTATASISVVRSAALMRQVDVPKIIFPIQAILVESYKFLVVLIVACGLLAALESLSYQTLYIFPFVFFASFTMLVGIGLVLSTIVPFFPDLKKMVPLAFQALIFLSGVFYQVERIPEQYRVYFYLNPFATLIESFRDVLMFGRVPDMRALFLVFLLGSVLSVVGLFVHWRYNRVFPRYLV